MRVWVERYHQCLAELDGLYEEWLELSLFRTNKDLTHGERLLLTRTLKANRKRARRAERGLAYVKHVIPNIELLAAEIARLDALATEKGRGPSDGRDEYDAEGQHRSASEDDTGLTELLEQPLPSPLPEL